MKNQALASVTFCLLAACSGNNAQQPDNAVPTATATPTQTVEPQVTATASVTAVAPTATAAPVEVKPQPAPVRMLGGMATPESVLYDEQADRYLIANINGKPLDDDNNGFIALFDPNAKDAVATKLVEGGKDKTKLSAPKGMAIVNGVLYVSDINRVRMFDRKSGAPKGEVAIEGATFLNDIAAGADGTIYVSDTGLNAEFKPTGTDAIWAIKGGKAKPLFKSPELGAPNGLFVDGKDVWVVTFGSGELYKVSDKGKSDVVKLPKGQLDGILKGGDHLFVSSWEASTVFVKKKGASDWTVAISGVKAPADLGWDKKRNLLAVPRFMDNVVEWFEVK